MASLPLDFYDFYTQSTPMMMNPYYGSTFDRPLHMCHSYCVQHRDVTAATGSLCTFKGLFFSSVGGSFPAPSRNINVHAHFQMAAENVRFNRRATKAKSPRIPKFPA